MTDDRTPSTEAGRALLARLGEIVRLAVESMGAQAADAALGVLATELLAIEAEARQQGYAGALDVDRLARMLCHRDADLLAERDRLAEDVAALRGAVESQVRRAEHRATLPGFPSEKQAWLDEAERLRALLAQSEAGR